MATIWSGFKRDLFKSSRVTICPKNKSTSIRTGTIRPGPSLATKALVLLGLDFSEVKRIFVYAHLRDNHIPQICVLPLKAKSLSEAALLCPNQ